MYDRGLFQISDTGLVMLCLQVRSYYEEFEVPAAPWAETLLASTKGRARTARSLVGRLPAKESKRLDLLPALTAS